MAEPGGHSRGTRGAKRRQRILSAAGGTAPPEVLVPLRTALVADAEGLNAHRRQHKTIRAGEDGTVRRSPQAVAGRKRGAQARGKPQRLLGVKPTEDGIPLLRHGRGHPDTAPGWHLRRCGGTHVRQAAPSRHRDHLLDVPGVSSHAEDSAGGKPATWGRT